MVHESIRSKQFSPNRQRLLFALLTFSSLTGGGAALAAGSAVPTGGQFVAGAGAIAQAANGLSISQSSTHGIINWQSFSIAAGQSVNIANGAGATLNRVTGGDLSTIAGSLTATGSVYVVNQSGVVVAPGGKVVTGGSFVASSRDVSNAQFMAGGAMTLSGTSAGTVVNQGTITSADGDVILVGKSVANSGSISAAKGTAALAAGDTVLLQASGDDAVLVSAGSGDVTNSGTIAAAQVQLDAVGGNVYALATNDGGVIRATGTATKDGHVYLTGGDSVSIDGAVSAVNADGSGGTVVATATAVNIGATAKISASGSTKGGTVLLGGDRHGGTDPTVALSKTPIANAKTTTVAAGAQISADAGAAGKGGNVVVWSDESTSFAGSISAQGGSISGDGGFVEVSGKGHLDFVGSVNTAAANGATGTLLLDPSDVTIVDNTGTYQVESFDPTTQMTINTPVSYTPPNPTTFTTSGPAYTPTGTGNTSAPGNNSSYILNTNIESLLANNNVTITTMSGGSAPGNILVAVPITWSGTGSLTLTADNAISFANHNALIKATGTGGITLNAKATAIASAPNPNPSTNSIFISAPLSTTSGDIDINLTQSGFGRFNTNVAGTITTTTGNINIVSKDNISTGSVISSTGGNINLVSTLSNSLMQITNSSQIQTGGNGTVLLESDEISLGSGNEPGETGHVVTGTAGKVTLQPSSNNMTLQVGTLASSPFLLDQDVANITTGTLVIGSNGTPVNTFTGGITVGIILADNLDNTSQLTMGGPGLGGIPPVPLTYPDGNLQNIIPLSTVNNLHLVSAGYVSANTAAVGNFQLAVGANGTGGLAVTAGSYIDLASATNTINGVPSVNHVGTLALQVTGSAGTAVAASDSVTSTASIQFAGDPTSGSLTIGTVDGVGGITAATGGVRSVFLNNAGAVTQSTAAGNQITAGSLDLEGNLGGTTATATYALNNIANAIDSIAGNFTSLSLYNDNSLANEPGGTTHSLTTTILGTTKGLNASNGIIIVENGNLTIADMAAVTTSSGAIKLEDQTFTDIDTTDGVNALAAGTGTWHVYSQNPLLDNDGALGKFDATNNPNGYNFVQYGATNGYAVGGDTTKPFATADNLLSMSTGATGNGFLYTVVPTASESLTGNLVKTYDGNTNVTQGLTSGNYTSVTYSYNAGTSFAAAGDVVTFSNPTGTGSLMYDTSHAGTGKTITGTPTVTIASAQDKNNVTVYGYQQNITNNLTGEIDQALLTISGIKTYDGTAGFTASQLSATGAVAGSGDTFTINAGSTGTATSSDARPATPYTGTINATISIANSNVGSMASDYKLPTTGALTINPIMLTVVGTKVYDAATTANANTFTTPLPGVLTADSSNVSLTGSGTLTGANAPNVGSYSTTGGTFALNTLALSLTGAQAGKQNYVLAGANYTVTTAMVTATGTRIYDGTTSVAAGTITSVSGLQGGDTFGTNIFITGTGSVSGKDVGTYNASGTGVGISGVFSVTGMMLTGADAGNYTLAPGTFIITPKALTVSGLAGQNKVYDGTTAATTTGTAGLGTAEAPGTGTTADGTPYTGDTVGVTGTATGTFAQKDTGTGIAIGSVTGLSLTGAQLGDYSLSAVTGLMANITPKALTYSGLTATNKIYDATAADTLTGTAALQTGEAYGSGTTADGKPYTPDAITLTATTGGSFAQKDVGTNIAVTVNGVSLVGDTHNDYTLTPLTGLMASITQKALTVSGLAGMNKVYDGTTAATTTGTAGLGTAEAPGTGTTADGTPYTGDTVGVTGTATGTFAQKDTGTGIAIGSVTGLSLTGAQLGDYSLSAVNGLMANITPKALTYSGLTATNKIYDATTADTLNGTAALQTGEAYGTGTTADGKPYTPDAITLTATTGGSFAQKDVGTNLAVTVNGVSLVGDTLNDYTLTPLTGLMANITPLAVTFTGTRVYDGMNDASSPILVFGNDLDGGNLTVSGTGVLASKNVGGEALTSTAGSLTGLTLGGSAAGNYTLMGASGTVTVTKASLVISAVTDMKVYDGGVTSTGTPTILGLQTGDTISSTPLTQVFASKNVLGTNGSTLMVNNFTGVNDGNAGGNYNVTVNTAMGTITPLAVTFTGTRVYDGMTDANSPILVFGNDLDGANLTVSGTGTLAGKNVGGEALTSTAGSLAGLTLGGSAAGNYTLMGGSGTVTVTKANLVISAVTDSKTYNATTGSVGTPTVAGLRTGDTVSATPLTQVFTSPNVLGTNGSTLMVNNFTGVSDGNSGGNYNVTVNTAMGTITPLAVSFTGMRVYDGMTDAAAPILVFGNDLDGANLTVSGTGVLANKNVGGEALTSAAGKLTGLTLGGTAAGNYTLTGASGTVTVTKANLVISAVTDMKVYDGGVSSTGTPTVTGLQTGDTISTTPLTQVFASKNVLGANGSTLMVNDFTGVKDGNSGGNYNVTVNTAMGTITPLAVSLTGTRVYDDGTDANSPILSVGNKVTGDTVTVASGSGVLGTKNVGTDPLASFGTLTLGGGDAGNYTLTGGTGTVTVTKANLVISAVTDTKVYDGGVSSLGTPTVTGLQTGDTISTTPLTQVFASKNVLGTNGSTLMVNDFTGVNDGNAGGNYNVTVNTAMGTITPLAVTLTGTRLYDGGTDGNAPILSVSDLIPGDSVTVATGTSTIASKNVGNEPITDFGTLTLGNNPNGNYTLVGATGVVTVTPLPITVTGTRVYNGTPGVDGSILTVTDKIPGDNLGVTGTGTAGSPHVGTQTITDPGTLALTGGDAGNYTVTGGGGTVVITPFAVNLTGTRVYDGGTDGNASILSVTNPFPGDTVDVASGTSTIANKNVGNEPITNFGTLVLGNNPNGDYTLIGATGTVIVTPQLLTVAAVPVAKTYDGTTTSAGTPIITSGTLHGTDTDSFTQRFNTPNAGTGLTLTPSGIVTDGNGGNNYVVTFVPITTGVINPRPVIVTGTRPFDNTPAAPGSILSITDLVPGDSVTLNGTGTLQSPAVGPEPVADFTGLTLVGGPASNYTLVGATGTVIITQTDLPSIAEIVTVPSSQTASGTGETVTFAAFEGGIVTLTPKQNGIVTGTIATIDGTDYHPDTQLACTLGNDGCVENGVAATPTK